MNNVCKIIFIFMCAWNLVIARFVCCNLFLKAVATVCTLQQYDDYTSRQPGPWRRLSIATNHCWQTTNCSRSVAVTGNWMNLWKESNQRQLAQEPMKLGSCMTLTLTLIIKVSRHSWPWRSILRHGMPDGCHMTCQMVRKYPSNQSNKKKL